MGCKLLKIMENWVIVLMFTFGVTSTVSAEEKNYYAKEGFYVGVMCPYNTVSGDFNGETALVAPDEIVIVPKVKSNYGWGVLLGRRSSRSALELSYLKSTHDGIFLGYKCKVNYNMVNVDFKSFFSADKPIQPYLLFGLCFPRLVVKDGSVDYFLNVGNATFKGIGLNIGGGLSYYLNPKASISLGVIYRWINYSSVESVGGGGSIEDGLKGNSLNFSATITFIF